MQQTLTLTRSDLHIRIAHPSDRAALEKIAAQVWGGDDYLPRVLDDWFSDPYDGFYVATWHDRVIGVMKVTRFDEAEWWLEGLRVDPVFQGQGLSRILHHFAVNQVRQRGHGVVRFSTSSDNDAVIKLAAETGFVRVAEYLPYGADALDERVAGLWPLGPSDLPRVRAWLDASSHFAQAQRSLEWDWSFYFLAETRLAERLDAGLVYGWPQAGDREHLAGLVIVNPAGDKDRWPEDALKVAYFDAGEITAVARDVRRLSAALGRMRVRWMVLKHPARMAAVERAGYMLEWDSEMWLYHRAVSLTEHANIQTG
jgi:GNAT superfamily N-acetyltransferase